MMQQQLAGAVTPLHLTALTFGVDGLMAAGCNTTAEITRANLAVNVERDIPWLETEPLKDKPLVIVAGGPSLKKYWYHINSHDGDVMALNNAYPFLTERGIFPKYFMMLDAREQNKEFLRSACPHTRHYIAGQCSPIIFDKLKGWDVRLYLTIMPGALEAVAHIDKPKVRIAGCVGTVGIKALCMAYALGYRELHLYGYDSSYDQNEHHAFPQKLNDDVATIDVYLDGARYVTTPTLSHQVSEFCQMAGDMTRAFGFDINLHCEGLLPDMVAHSNARGEIPLEIREAAKYAEMWEHDAYRRTAPGERHVDRAIEMLGMEELDTVADFGCGTGRAATALQARGFSVAGIDFAENCIAGDCNFTFVKSCLWDLPEMHVKHGFCTDVMEHIPTEKVESVLEGIAKRARACYFNIATTDDTMGGLIGYKLHLTVMSADEWAKLLRKFWKEVEVYPAEIDAVFVCKQPLTT